jgi:hypothetical protein
MTESYRVLAAAAERLSEDDLASWSRCRGWTGPTCCSTCRWTPRGGFSFALSKEVIDGLSDLSATIRRYRDSDKAAVYDVCVRTANAGRGVGGRYSTR